MSVIHVAPHRPLNDNTYSLVVLLRWFLQIEKFITYINEWNGGKECQDMSDCPVPDESMLADSHASLYFEMESREARITSGSGCTSAVLSASSFLCSHFLVRVWDFVECFYLAPPNLVRNMVYVCKTVDWISARRTEIQSHLKSCKIRSREERLSLFAVPKVVYRFV